MTTSTSSTPSSTTTESIHSPMTLMVVVRLLMAGSAAGVESGQRRDGDGGDRTAGYNGRRSRSGRNGEIGLAAVVTGRRAAFAGALRAERAKG